MAKRKPSNPFMPVPIPKKGRKSAKQPSSSDQAVGCLLIVAIIVGIITFLNNLEGDNPAPSTQNERPTQTNTPRPTRTFSPTDVPNIASTNTPSSASNDITSTDSTASRTAIPTATSPTTTTQQGVSRVNDTGIVIGDNVNIRACASTSCDPIGRVSSGETYTVTGRVRDGQSIQGNSLWYEIRYQGQVGYVSATLMRLSSEQPVVVPVSRPTQSNNAPSVQPTQPIVAPSNGWTCVGNLYNCDDFGSGGQFSCQQLYEYMSTCPNDPSRLDRENDGRFCESQCG